MKLKPILISCAACLVAVAGLLLVYKNDKQENAEITKHDQEVIETAKPAVAANTSKDVKPASSTSTPRASYDEFSDTLPLSAIVSFSKLPANIKKSINKLIKDSDVYYAGVENDKVLIIKSANTEGERFTRHDFEIYKISLKDGIVEKDANFPMQMSNDESQHEIWKYDEIEKDTIVPISHESLSEAGKMHLTESWYYSQEEPTKYKVVNEDNKTLSLRKTSQNDDGTWRDEHIFYDENGKTLLNVSFMYKENQLSRFTFYDALNPEYSTTVVTDYDDEGQKTKETVYSDDYKVLNVYEAEYVDGKRNDIKIIPPEALKQEN